MFYIYIYTLIETKLNIKFFLISAWQSAIEGSSLGSGWCSFIGNVCEDEVPTSNVSVVFEIFILGNEVELYEAESRVVPGVCQQHGEYFLLQQAAGFC